MRNALLLLLVEHNGFVADAARRQLAMMGWALEVHPHSLSYNTHLHSLS